MKKLLFLAVMFVTALTAGAQDTIGAFLYCDPPVAYILNKPRGATVMSLDYEDIYIFGLTSPQDGWWKIVELWTVEDDVTSSMTGSDTGEYWVHYSILGLGTRNYGGQELCLRAEPDEEADVVFTFNKELTLKPIDIQDDWIKVMVDGYDIVGWIEAEWLCSNPVTNCC